MYMHNYSMTDLLTQHHGPIHHSVESNETIYIAILDELKSERDKQRGGALGSRRSE